MWLVRTDVTLEQCYFGGRCYSHSYHLSRDLLAGSESMCGKTRRLSYPWQAGKGKI